MQRKHEEVVRDSDEKEKRKRQEEETRKRQKEEKKKGQDEERRMEEVAETRKRKKEEQRSSKKTGEKYGAKISERKDERSGERTDERTGEEEERSRMVEVTNFPPGTTVDGLDIFLSSMGDLVPGSVAVFPQEQERRVSGRAVYVRKEGQELSLRWLDNQEIGGIRIRVQRAVGQEVR